MDLESVPHIPITLQRLPGFQIMAAEPLPVDRSSFPGMQKAVDLYKNDPQVAFVFVDTWERVPDKAKVVGDFITEKGYRFNVLLDTDDKVVGAYGVSGIPTKFIIDKAGHIRFKSVGFGGDADALVDELGQMIDLVKAQP